MHPLYKVMLEALRTDGAQMVEEGHDVAALEREIDAAAAAESLDALAALQMDLWNRPSPASFLYQEPNDWEAISATFPSAESHERFGGGAEELADRLLAAWQGRCVGCQLGKPLEGLIEPQRVRQGLEVCDSWPLTDYVKPLADASAAPAGTPAAHMAKVRHLARGRMQYVEPDDDIHYAISGLRVLERRGLEFTARDVMEELRATTPQGILFASGLNMVRDGALGLESPATALFGNEYRQSLGATIRCDPWGWAGPANPALAARLAWRDGAASQRRNGIYAGVFFATLLADVISHGDPVRAIETAAGYVPPRSRFAEMVGFVRETCAATGGWEAANEIILERYHRRLLRAAKLRMNHCLPNGAICIMALLKGAGEFSRTITIGVMAGMDTDCNGATLGSIMGAALGARGIDQRWTAPLNDTVRTELLRMHELRISDLGRRTFEVAKGNCRYA